jgi:hypothetical protein
MTSPREIAGSGLSPQQFRHDIVEACEPVILRGFVGHWPAVQAGRTSPKAFADYVLRFDAGSTMEAFFGDPKIGGKYYYRDGLKGFNFERRTMRFAEALEAVLANLERPDASSVYIGSIPVDINLPGFSKENPIPQLPPAAAPRIWLGHASNVSCHYDAYENVACVVAGSRRFTLYAPELIGKLYIGPIDNTMAGQPVSLAASSPEDDRYPLFREIKDQALIAELEAGDALFLPKLWWHQVEGTAPFNGLVNYWWDAFSIGPDAPYITMLLAMIAIGERPPKERQAWKAYFDNYVFRTNGHPLAHLPAEAHGLLGPLKPDNYGKIRAHIMHVLRSG